MCRVIPIYMEIIFNSCWIKTSTHLFFCSTKTTTKKLIKNSKINREKFNNINFFPPDFLNNTTFFY